MHTGRQRGRPREDEAETGVRSHRKQEEVRKCSSLAPSEAVRPSQLLDFGHLASRTVREKISVVFCHVVCGNLLGQPQETNAGTSSVCWYKMKTES